MSIVTIDGAPIDRANLARMLARPITQRERPGGVVGAVVFALGSLGIGGFLAVGAAFSFPISIVLTVLETMFAALFLYLGWCFITDAARGWQRDRRGLRVTYGVEDVIVEEYGERRRLSLDEPFAHGLEPRVELRRIVAVRQAFRGDPADSALRKAMEWAVWIYLDGPRQGDEPLYVALPEGAQPFSFYASSLREVGDDIGHLLERGVPVVRLALRPGPEGLEPIPRRSAAVLITRPLFEPS